MLISPGGNRPVLSTADVAFLGEKEALQRLELLATTSRILDTTLEEFDQAMIQVAESCVADFADLCAIEVIGADGEIRTVAYRHARRGGLELGERWTPIGRRIAPDRKPVLTFVGPDEVAEVREIRHRLAAQSMISVPIAGGGLTLGWFVAATGEFRRGFRPSALSIGAELGSRLSTTIQRAMLLREMQASVREQNRAVRRLRRLATAATNLAGAATPQAVLDVACFEACVIHDADGAMAQWQRADGRVETAEAGQVDKDRAAQAFASVSERRSDHGDGWVAYSLPNTDPWEHAALVVFVGDDFATEEELVLSSLASLIPVAFERAVGTEAAVVHEARLQAVVEGAPVALMALNSSMTVTMANRSADQLFGSAFDPVGLPVDGELAPAVTELVQAVIAQNSVVNRMVSVASRDVSLTGAPLPSVFASDQPTVLVAGLDLSEIRRAERSLVEAQRLEAMGQVAGRVAHDFNNVLTLIVGYSALLRRGISDRAQQGLLDSIDDASHRAAALTQQMLGMTRRSVGSAVVIDGAKGLSAMTDVLAKLVGPGVDLRVETPPEGVLVGLDLSELEQIVVNLVINASDAMAGRGSVFVGLELAEPPPETQQRLNLAPGPCAAMTVADNGPGMDAEVLARCLEPFFTTKPREHGSGLGLPTVYGLVSDIGGRLELDSEPGSGTTIRIWLPLHQPDADVNADPSGVASALTADRRILLVDDDPELNAIANATLVTAGLVVAACHSAEEALDLLASDVRFDALITDVVLPGMSGVELVAAARVIDPTIRVMYMTGHSGPTSPPLGPISGDPVLRKPFGPDDLRLWVVALVGHPGS